MNVSSNVDTLNFTPCWYLGAQVGLNNTTKIDIAYTDTYEIIYDGIGRNETGFASAL